MPQPIPHPPDHSVLASRLEELRQTLAGVDPAILARNTASRYLAHDPVQGEFELDFIGHRVDLAYPAGRAAYAATGNPLPDFLQALILYYFITADGSPRAGSWISFGDLPDGRFYNQAYQGYTGAQIARRYQNDLEAFAGAARRVGGILPAAQDTSIPGDLAYEFNPLPAVYLLVTYWSGDEDFAPSCQILFDASVPYYLPTEACAILGSLLTRQLVKE